MHRKPNVDFKAFEALDLRIAEVMEAAPAKGTRFPCRFLKLNVGDLGVLTSVGQFMLVDEAHLVGRKVVVCINLGERRMGDLKSQCLVLGTRHQDSPKNENQAVPLFADPSASNGAHVY